MQLIGDNHVVLSAALEYLENAIGRSDIDRFC